MDLFGLLQKIANAANSSSNEGNQNSSLESTRKALKMIRTFSSPVFYAPVGAFAFIIIFMFFFADSGPSGGSGGGGSSGEAQPPPAPGVQVPVVPTIPGLTVTLTGLDQVENGTPITYEVKFTYDPAVARVPLENIELFITLPSIVTFVDSSGETSSTVNTVVWPLRSTQNQSGFTFSLQPTVQDTFVTITVAARVGPQQGNGAPPAVGSSGNACTEPYEGSGHCSVANLTPAFGGDASVALVASMVCQQESGSNPFANSLDNLPCPPDYSIGLFQINQLAHCPEAFSDPQSCVIGNQATLDACIAKYKDPNENINYAYGLYKSGGTGWTVNKWGAYQVVEKKLSECGIL